MKANNPSIFDVRDEEREIRRIRARRHVWRMIAAVIDGALYVAFMAVIWHCL